MHDVAQRSLIIATLILGQVLPVGAQQQGAEPPAQRLPPIAGEPEPGADPPALTAEDARQDLLDALFQRLASEDADDWERVEVDINAIWHDSGSASMDLLMRRADKAMAAEDFETALLHLGDLTRLAPDFAEGWNKRATVYFLQDNYGLSLEDIARTLRLEPRHFGALSGLGIILDRLGDKKGALEAFRRANKLHPHLQGAQEGIKKLSREVEGERL